MPLFPKQIKLFGRNTSEILVVFQFLIEIVLWDSSYSCVKVYQNDHFEKKKCEKWRNTSFLYWFSGIWALQIVKADLLNHILTFLKVHINVESGMLQGSFWRSATFISIITIELSYLSSRWTILNNIILRSSIQLFWDLSHRRLQYNCKIIILIKPQWYRLPQIYLVFAFRTIKLSDYWIKLSKKLYI